MHPAISVKTERLTFFEETFHFGNQSVTDCTWSQAGTTSTRQIPLLKVYLRQLFLIKFFLLVLQVRSHVN